MPFINISVAGTPLNETQVDSLIEGTTLLMATLLKKRADVTSVRVNSAPEDNNWGIGNEQTGCRAHMDIKITAGTNDMTEKAEMIAAADRLMRNVLTGLPLATYCVIDEIPATDWGYGGITQSERAQSMSSTNTPGI